MYVVPQTTEVVNLTLTSYGGKEQTSVSGGSALRLPIVCQEELRNDTSNSGKLFATLCTVVKTSLTLALVGGVCYTDIHDFFSDE